MTHAEKLAAAIAWLRARNNYALDRGSRAYKPLFVFPLDFK